MKYFPTMFWDDNAEVYLEMIAECVGSLTVQYVCLELAWSA
jgi:hypothetical protein